MIRKTVFVFVLLFPLIYSAGVLAVYFLGQAAIWFTWHFIILFLKIVFPFHLPSSDKMKYIYLICVITGILFPLISIVISVIVDAVNLQEHSDNSTSKHTFFTEGLGYRSPRFPALLCIGSNEFAVFYSLALPLDIIIGLGCTMFLIIFWSVHKLKRKRKKEQVSWSILVNIMQ